MDFGKLLSKAWDLLWKNAFLILLGGLAVLGGTGTGGGNQSRFAFQGDDFNWRDFPRFDYGGPFQNWDLPAVAAGGVILLVLFGILVALLLWALGTVARGGLISAVNDLEEDQPTNFGTAFQAGWVKGWQLLGIGLVPAVPGVVLLIFGIASLVSGSGLEKLRAGGMSWEGLSALSPLLVLACVLVPVGFVLSLLRTFANRACMLEDRGVLASYQRGLEVLGANLGPVLILFLLQIAISIAGGIILFVPGILTALCCLLWPLLLLVRAAFAAYYSSLWTLAWREWVNLPAPIEG
jgi:hypothetical protein